MRDECKEKIGDLTVAVPAEPLIFIVNRMGKASRILKRSKTV